MLLFPRFRKNGSSIQDGGGTDAQSAGADDFVPGGDDPTPPPSDPNAVPSVDELQQEYPGMDCKMKYCLYPDGRVFESA